MTHSGRSSQSPRAKSDPLFTISAYGQPLRTPPQKRAKYINYKQKKLWQQNQTTCQTLQHHIERGTRPKDCRVYAKHRKVQIYVVPELSTNNEQWINPDFGTSELRTHYDNIKQMVKEKTGRAMQILLIRADTTLAYVRKFGEECRRR